MPRRPACVDVHNKWLRPGLSQGHDGTCPPKKKHLLTEVSSTSGDPSMYAWWSCVSTGVPVLHA
jgi:hypothetical protein